MRLVIQKIYKGQVAAEYNMTVNDFDSYVSALETFEIAAEYEEMVNDLNKEIVTMRIPLETGGYDEQAH